MIVDDGQAVDDDALLHRVVTRRGDLATGVVGAVAADVDHSALRLQLVGRQHRHGGVDTGTDGGAAIEAARFGQQPVGEAVGGGGVADHGEVDDFAHLGVAGKLDIGDGNAANGAGLDGGEHGRVEQGRGDALFFQIVFAVVNRAGHVGDQHQGEIHRLGRAGGERA